MKKKIIISGILGCIVLIVWVFIVNVIFGFQARIDMKQIPEERQVYEIIKEYIVVPGRYIFNPKPTPEGGSPDGEPVFGIFYGGVGHEAAGNQMTVELLVFFLVATIGAWMLSQTSERILDSYPRKVLFFTAIGLVIALFSDMRNFGIASYPLKDALMLALNHVIVWTLMGLVIAWRIKPSKQL